MRIPYYQINAFTNTNFGGNPAGVCPLNDWLPDEILQGIAAENNLSETAFFIPLGEDYHLRWFTPTVEVDLCGHATLAPAFVLFSEPSRTATQIRFQTKSGWLMAERRKDRIELDFPSRPPTPCAPPEELLSALGVKPLEVQRSRDYLAIYRTQEEVAQLTPNMDLLQKLDSLGVIATAPGNDSDFVSRFFAPRAGVPEDPVTGSSHSTLIPYWSERLGKHELFARQISRRGGELYCRANGNRVGIGGHAVYYFRGEIELNGIG